MDETTTKPRLLDETMPRFWLMDERTITKSHLLDETMPSFLTNERNNN